VREDEDSRMGSPCTLDREPSHPCTMQEIIVAPISCNKDARRLGSDEKMLVIGGCGHPETDCCFDFVFWYTIMP
jgi:hypothetical protein